MANIPENPGQQPEVQPKLALGQRVDNYWLEKNDWKRINGGCPISPDPVATLKTLSENVRPVHENLAAMVRSSLERRDKQGRSMEEIWAEKISAGANYVGVLEGVFHFFKDEEILAEDNKDLRISALPAMLEFREKEKQLIRDRTRAEMAALRAGLSATRVDPEPEVYLPPGEIILGGGSDNI